MPHQRLYAIAFFTILLLAGVGCTKEHTANDVFTDYTDTVGEAIDLEALIQKIPRATQVPGLLERSGAEFVPSLVNNTRRAQSYLITDSKTALNLGIYGTDLAYLATYNQTAATVDFFKTSKMLADKLGVAEGFDKNLIQRFQASLSNKDSMLFLIETSLSQVRDFLNSNHRHGVQAHIMTGSFIEGLYLSTQLHQHTAKNLEAPARSQVLIELTRVILEQRTTLNRLMEFLNKAAALEPSINELINRLTPLEKAFERLDVHETMQQNESSRDFNNEALQEITKIANVIRSEMVEP